MSRPATRLWQRFLAAALPQVTARIERMPREKALARGAALGRLGYRWARKPRDAARRNLALVFPELSAAEREALIKKNFEHWGKVTMDFLKAPTYDAAAVARMVPALEGFEEYARPALESGKGIVAATAHIGSFEMFGRFTGLRGIGLTVIVRAPKDPVFGGYVKRMRESGGYKTIDSYGGLALRELLRTLRRGEVVAILPDQNANDLFVPFFGVPAGTADGAALLAYKTGATLLAAFCVLQPDDTYKVVVRPPILVDPKGDRETEVRAATERISAEIEWAARQWPEQYLWLHNRFKGSFEPQYRSLWPEGYDYDALKSRWESG